MENKITVSNEFKREWMIRLVEAGKPVKYLGITLHPFIVSDSFTNGPFVVFHYVSAGRIEEILIPFNVLTKLCQDQLSE